MSGDRHLGGIRTWPAFHFEDGIDRRAALHRDVRRDARGHDVR